ncbi:MAG TPA: hypothetical protein PL143_17330 [Rhodocyclaceae bacterium]|nr:hypothetical protein [Rhodocyclaceae bacterium]
MYDEPLAESLKSGKTLTAVIYGLYASSFFVGITALIAIIINYVKIGDLAGTFLESHFRWQIRTFWIGLAGSVIGTVTTPLMIGWPILALTAIWVIYRIVRGFMRLGDNKAMYAELSPAR